jgi:hypothetical protein
VDAGFRGFSAEVFDWFAGLERDNSKAYFTATRERYEDEVRGGLEAMLEELSEQFGGHVRVFRQQRDLRFSPDKSPYKTRTYGVLRTFPGWPPGSTRSCRRAASTPARATTSWPATSSRASATPSSTTGPDPRSPRRPRPRRRPGSSSPDERGRRR